MVGDRFTTPVVLLIFNRPDTTKRVFAEIAKAKPAKLLVVGDGARDHKPGEAQAVAAARAIAEEVNWECEVISNYSPVNLGCKRRVASGLDWEFEHVEEAIILEDDCLPHPSFSPFCQELIERYRDDQRIGMISGDNFRSGLRTNSDSYYFSRFTYIWGWATWRDRWAGSYDVTMREWSRVRDEDWIADLVPASAERKYWLTVFENVFQGKINTWDFQWTFACWLNSRLAVVPNVNLVSNIGFGDGATHTIEAGGKSNLQTEKWIFH